MILTLWIQVSFQEFEFSNGVGSEKQVLPYPF